MFSKLSPTQLKSLVVLLSGSSAFFSFSWLLTRHRYRRDSKKQAHAIMYLLDVLRKNEVTLDRFDVQTLFELLDLYEFDVSLLDEEDDTNEQRSSESED